MDDCIMSFLLMMSMVFTIPVPRLKEGGYAIAVDSNLYGMPPCTLSAKGLQCTLAAIPAKLPKSI